MAMDIDRLIVRVYEAGLSGGGWDEVASLMSDALGARALWAQLKNAGTPQPPFLLHGISPRAAEANAGRCWRLNLTSGPTSTSQLDEVRELDVAGAGVVRRTQPFRDWAVPERLVHSLGWWGRVGEEAVLEVTVTRNVDVAWSELDVRFLHRVAPHVSNATRLERTLRSAREEACTLRSLLDSLRCAAFLLDGDGGIAAANAPARSLLRAGEVLWDERCRLRVSHPRADAELRAAVAARRSDQLGRPVYLGPVGRGTPLAFVLPRVAPDGTREAGAVVLVPPSGASSTALTEWLVRSHGLTPAEAEVALQLSSGTDLRVIAEERSTSIGTVRNQVKRAMEKLGVRRRQQLVSMLVAAAGPLQAGNGQKSACGVPTGT